MMSALLVVIVCLTAGQAHRAAVRWVERTLPSQNTPTEHYEWQVRRCHPREHRRVWRCPFRWASEIGPQTETGPPYIGTAYRACAGIITVRRVHGRARARGPLYCAVAP